MARPRSYDPHTALDRVQKTFWEKGYHGTSLQDLEKATDLKKQSLYREFGNKDALYHKALALYQDREIAALANAMLAPSDALTRFSKLFELVLQPVYDGDRSGCFLCNAALDRAQEDSETNKRTQDGITQTTQLFETALRVSSPYKDDKALLRSRALEFTAGYFGLRVMIRGGLPIATLKATVEALLDQIKTDSAG